MSKENNQPKGFNSGEDEERFGVRRKPWNYPDLSTNFHQSQNRTCCSPADEIEAMVKVKQYFKLSKRIYFQSILSNDREILNIPMLCTAWKFKLKSQHCFYGSRTKGTKAV